MSRLRVPHVERLTARIAIGVSLLLLGPLAGGLYLLSAVQYNHAVAARRAAADIENRILETALRHDMLARDTALITGILQDVGRQPEVLRAMIIDHNGVIKLSSRPAEVGVRTSRTSPTCLVCHAESPTGRRRWVTLKENGADVLRTVLPIENRPECHRCHDPGTRWNGMMVLDVSLAPGAGAVPKRCLAAGRRLQRRGAADARRPGLAPAPRRPLAALDAHADRARHRRRRARRAGRHLREATPSRRSPPTSTPWPTPPRA